ncbi:MAG: J domain-containing protein [Patescibacteria group bacterium]|nr:J domain-containing protein [Patescibacteria group bacterium]
MKKDYYQILGVNKTANQDEIKTAYRKLAHKYHPDKPGGDEKKFKEINEAYQVLSNPEKRKQFDQFGDAFNNAGNGYAYGGNYGAGQNPFGGFGFDFSGFNGGNAQEFDFGEFGDLGDILETMFTGRRTRRPRKGASLEFVQEISLEEAFGGTNKKISYHISSGKKDIDINIAPGINDGQMIKIPGAGEVGEKGAESGDLYVRIKIAPHPVFRRIGNDLLVKKEVSLIDILLNKKIEIPIITGGKINIEIPTGFTLQEKLVIPNEGMPKQDGSVSLLRGGRGRGNLLVEFITKTPKKFSSRVKKILEDLEKEIT